MYELSLTEVEGGKESRDIMLNVFLISLKLISLQN